MAQRARTTTRSNVPALEIDPAASGTVIRVAMLVESIINILTALPLMLDPASMLQPLLIAGTTLSPNAVVTAQYFGLLVLGITAGMLLAIPNKPGAVEWRRMFYANSFWTESLGALLALWQVHGLGDEGTGMQSRKLVVFAVLPFCALTLWRAYVFCAKPEWFGRYRAAEKVD